MPHHRANLERVKSPGLAGLKRHKKHHEGFVTFQAFGHALNTYNATMGMYRSEVAKAWDGQPADVAAVREKVTALANLKAALTPGAEALRQSKSRDLQRMISAILESPEAEASAEFSKRVFSLNTDGLSKRQFEDAVRAIEAEVFADVVMEGDE